MLIRCNRFLAKLGFLTVSGCVALPFTVEDFGHLPAGCSDSSCSDISVSDHNPGVALLQQRFEKAIVHDFVKEAQTHSDGLNGAGSPEISFASYRWGGPESEHPPSIGKSGPHPSVQQYEARLPYLSSMVLNIFSKKSDGKGGLMLALEVPSPCGKDQGWKEVDRTRCSSRYPCTLRLPSAAVRGSDTEPTVFRTRVLRGYDDYQTTFLEYKRVTLDHDAEVVVAHQSHGEDLVKKSTVRFTISPAIAAGALSVTPILKGPNKESVVSMRLRQPKETTGTEAVQSVLEQESQSGPTRDRVEHREEREAGMQKLDSKLKSYRASWAGRWRAASKNVSCCDLSYFEVVADSIYPGEVDLEVWVTGGNDTSISDVLVTTRASWAEAEVKLLDHMMKDHFAFFNDPEAIIHGLPMGALKKDDPKALTLSNPTEWGYAMESWVIMAESGVLKPEEAVAKLNISLATLTTLQQDEDAFAHGMFFPYYKMRDWGTGEKIFPEPTDAKELPCGDDALFYASLMTVQGWLQQNRFEKEAGSCANILRQMDFSKCIRKTQCEDASGIEGDKFWSVALTFNSETLAPNAYNWNVWADEGGIVAMIVALSGSVNFTQYESIVRQQQRYSACSHWEGITVGQSAFFNSIFTLPTRSMLGFGTLFASPYYHEFAVRSVLPSFRAHQKLKKKLKVDYMGPSDAMSQQAKPGKFFGSYAYWPPNNMYDCAKGKILIENQCTWCKGIQYEGLDDPFEIVVPHGNMASFLASAMMEKSQFTAWLEDTKLLMTDASKVYTPGYGLEVVAPARRTPLQGNFQGALDGRGIWESLSYGYTVLSMYEGLATMRRRFDLIKQEGFKVPGSYEPPEYTPLSDFLGSLPEVRAKINKLLDIAREQETTEKRCGPSQYGPAGHY